MRKIFRSDTELLYVGEDTLALIGVVVNVPGAIVLWQIGDNAVEQLRGEEVVNYNMRKRFCPPIALPLLLSDLREPFTIEEVRGDNTF